MKDINLNGLRHLIVQNEYENTVYHVISQKPLNIRGKLYIVIEEFKTGIKYYVQVCPKVGVTRLLLRADFLVGFEVADQWVVARNFGDGIIRVEYKDF